MPRRSRNAAANAADTLVEGHVAARLRLRRALLGMSQSDLGKALGITFQQVQKYERGSNKVSVGNLHRLADILDVPMAFFFDGLEGGNMDRPSIGEASEPASVLFRRELDLLRACRQAPPEIADTVAGLLRSIAPEVGATRPSFTDGMPAVVLSEPDLVPARVDEVEVEAPRRRGRPPGKVKALDADTETERPAQRRERKRRRAAGSVWGPPDIRDYREE